MARKRVRQQIEIERNVVEKSLMQIKAFVKEQKKRVIYFSLSVVLLLIATISGFAYYEFSTTRNLRRFEKIMDGYNAIEMKSDEKMAKNTINQLKNFIDSSSFGYSHTMAYYALGNIFYSQKNYPEAKKYLQKFADKSSSNLFQELALIKVACSMEELGELDGALKVYNDFEEDNPDSILMDQVSYNTAGIYAKKKDAFNAKKYYDKVITAYPQSPYAMKSKRMMFLLSANETK